MLNTHNFVNEYIVVFVKSNLGMFYTNLQLDNNISLAFHTFLFWKYNFIFLYGTLFPIEQNVKYFSKLAKFCWIRICTVQLLEIVKCVQLIWLLITKLKIFWYMLDLNNEILYYNIFHFNYDILTMVKYLDYFHKQEYFEINT